jgi:hypothetical protein
MNRVTNDELAALYLLETGLFIAGLTKRKMNDV